MAGTGGEGRATAPLPAGTRDAGMVPLLRVARLVPQAFGSATGALEGRWRPPPVAARRSRRRWT
jgi:hypothetical protein